MTRQQKTHSLHLSAPANVDVAAFLRFTRLPVATQTESSAAYVFGARQEGYCSLPCAAAEFSRDFVAFKELVSLFGELVIAHL